MYFIIIIMMLYNNYNDVVHIPTTSVSEEGLDSLMSLLFSNIVRTGVKVVTMIVFVNQMLLIMAGDTSFTLYFK